MQQWPMKIMQKLPVSVMLCSECCKPEKGPLVAHTHKINM
jgi:hypothetical protein